MKTKTETEITNWFDPCVGTYTCPECGKFTKPDEWAKPDVACINCGVEE